MIYNLEGHPMTMVERVRMSVTQAPGRSGSEVFQQLELPQK
jgi:hypothetical protein